MCSALGCWYYRRLVVLPDKGALAVLHARLLGF